MTKGRARILSVVSICFLGFGAPGGTAQEKPTASPPSYTPGSPGTEEIWLQLRGKSLLFFGNRLLWQEPGEAFLIPPNHKVPHASINHSEEPMLWLFMGCSHPEDAGKGGMK